MSLLRFVTWASMTCAFVATSCSSGGAGDLAGGGGSSSTGTIDGTWDITEAGRGNIAPSEMTIANGVVTGAVIGRNEGDSVGACKTLKDRGEFKLTFEGNSLSGTITEVREYEGTDCPSPRNRVTPITGSRAIATAGAGLTGEWEVMVGSDSSPFIVVVDGVNAKAWDKEDKADGKEPAASVVVAGGSATVTADDSDLSFAARRR